MFRLPYEELIVAIGAHNQTFNIPGNYLYVHTQASNQACMQAST